MERDLLWKDIMERYIPDDFTLIKTRKTKDGVVLAVAGIERGDQYLDIYVAEDYLMVFYVSGYMTGLLEQGEEYWNECFNEDECKEIREAYDTLRWQRFCEGE